MAALSVKLKGDGVLWLCRTILEADAHLYLDPTITRHLGDRQFTPAAGRGLPVGYLTSQVWGNFYLNGLDHFVKRELKVSGYLRYMDNLTLFADTRKELKAHLNRVREFLGELDLQIREDRVKIGPCSASVDYLGYRVTREGHVVLKPALRRLHQKVRRALFSRAPANPEVLRRMLAAFRGILRF